MHSVLCTLGYGYISFEIIISYEILIWVLLSIYSWVFNADIKKISILIPLGYFEQDKYLNWNFCFANMLICIFTNYCGVFCFSGMPRWCLTHWGQVTHVCGHKLTIIWSDNGLSPVQHQAIIWINARILLIGPLDTNFSEVIHFHSR